MKPDVGTHIVNGSQLGMSGTSWGIFSNCESYRYLLAVPTGLPNERIATFCLANPSTATPDELDPTLTRCLDYAKRWGFGWLWVANVRAWRETDPKKVPADPQAIGPLNNETILRAALGASLVVCGWGKFGGELGKKTLDRLLSAGVVPHALKLNNDGSPAHPLYLRADLEPFAFGSSA